MKLLEINLELSFVKFDEMFLTFLTLLIAPVFGKPKENALEKKLKLPSSANHRQTAEISWHDGDRDVVATADWWQEHDEGAQSRGAARRDLREVCKP